LEEVPPPAVFSLGLPPTALLVIDRLDWLIT
jgi:hypothetical protein